MFVYEMIHILKFQRVTNFKLARLGEPREPWDIKKDGGASLFPHQIVDFAPANFALTPAPAPAQPVF